MEHLIDLAKSDIGVAIAWICTVGSIIFAIFKNNENKTLKLKVKSLTTTLTDQSQDNVTFNGERSVYTKSVSGGMKIDM